MVMGGFAPVISTDGFDVSEWVGVSVMILFATSGFLTSCVEHPIKLTNRKGSMNFKRIFMVVTLKVDYGC